MYVCLYIDNVSFILYFVLSRSLYIVYIFIFKNTLFRISFRRHCYSVAPMHIGALRNLASSAGSFLRKEGVRWQYSGFLCHSCDFEQALHEALLFEGLLSSALFLGQAALDPHHVSRSHVLLEGVAFRHRTHLHMQRPTQ